jgi:hypothetical protein
VNALVKSSAEADETRTLPRPAGAAPGVVAVAWPTGRRIYPYTPEELAGGVDVYTRALKTAANSAAAGADREE